MQQESTIVNEHNIILAFLTNLLVFFKFTKFTPKDGLHRLLPYFLSKVWLCGCFFKNVCVLFIDYVLMAVGLVCLVNQVVLLINGDQILLLNV